MKHQSLYNEELFIEKFSNIDIDKKQRQAQKQWLELLENKKLEKEVENYRNFEDIILRDLLGFPEEILRSGQNQENVEFVYKDPDGNWAVLFEAKGHETADLFAKQHRIKNSQDSPYVQTDTNMGRFSGISSGVCTNYQNFILIDSFNRLTKCHEFNFLTTKNNDEKLKEFIGIFSYDALVLKKIHSKLHKDSAEKDKKFNTEFYKLFHETRLMIIKAFKEKENVSQTESELYTQIFLDRILFLFFALDKGLILDENGKPNNKLFSNRILKQLQLDQCTKNSKKIFDDINLLFIALDQGDEILHINGFNGTLFSGKIPEKVNFLDFQEKHFFSEEYQNSKLSKPPKLTESQEKIFKKYGNLVNPIIRNLLILDSFDFTSQVNVTILGHILEQSIEDLDRLRKSGNVDRKIDGVYYTPETITDYICKNTIIPYLSKNNSNTVTELISEYHDDIQKLEEKIDNIRIIDPACGSGAFLIKAAEILLEITEKIDEIKDTQQTKMTEFFPEKEISKIIEKNIFGVDINKKSVEIAKLSLFLKMARVGEPLTNISKNIIAGNSLIDDKKIDSSGNVWIEKFSTILNDGGFDIVLGNPPWQGVKPDVDEFFSSLKEMQLLLVSKYHNKKIKFSKLPSTLKDSLMKECLKQKNIQESYDDYLNNYKIQMDYFNSSSFKLQGTGDTNLYKLFVEKSLEIINKNGVFGMVIPSGIYYDQGTKELRETMFEKNSVQELCGFVNKKPVFEDVHRQFKFCTLILKKGKQTKKFLTKFFVLDDDNLKNFRKTAYEYDWKFVKDSSPLNLIMLESSNLTEQHIFEKLYKFPILESQKWPFKPTRELDMSFDKDLFHTGDIGPKLYEGKMIHMFSHILSPPRYWLEKDEVENRLKQREFNRTPAKIKKSNPDFSPELHAQEYRLVWRSGANSTDTRTLITTILPPNVFLGNSLNYLVPISLDNGKYVKTISNVETVFLCGILNSFVQDFIMKHKTSRNINYFHINGQPIPRFDEKNLLHKKIVKNTSMLICTSDEFKELRYKLKIPEYVTEQPKRLALEAQINAWTAKIYGLTKEELEYILGLFSSQNKILKELTLDEFSLL